MSEFMSPIEMDEKGRIIERDEKGEIISVRAEMHTGDSVEQTTDASEVPPRAGSLNYELEQEKKTEENSFKVPERQDQTLS